MNKPYGLIETLLRLTRKKTFVDLDFEDRAKAVESLLNLTEEPPDNKNLIKLDRESHQ